MMSEADSMPARLKRLPVRLRIAHVAALMRCGKLIIREGSLSYPFPRVAVGRGDLGKTDRPPTLACASLRPSLPTASRGEGSKRDGRAG
jgi:hypothetical protein